MNVRKHNEAKAITGNEGSTTKDLRKTGTQYWLAAKSTSTDLFYMGIDGSIHSSSGGGSMGFRPVVVLKSTVLTTGKGTDQVGNTNAWILA